MSWKVRHRRLAPAMLCAILLFTSMAAALAAEDLPLRLRATRIELEVALDYEDGSLGGSAALTVENVSDQPVQEVPLLLNRLMTIQSAAGPSGEPFPFEQDVVVFDDWPKMQVTHAVVRLSRAVPPGASASLRVAYSGFLVGYQETGMLYVQDRIDESFSILREEALAFPVVGLPSWQRNRLAPERDFEYRVAITLPKQLTVANGGKLEEHSIRGEEATWVYRSRAPVPFLNLAIAEYEQLSSGGVKVFFFPEDADGAGVLLQRAQAALDRLAGWFGALAGAAELAIIEIPDGWGSQASLAGGIILEAGGFTEPGQLIELYHELSHLWNAPDRERPSPRWNEGLATFLQHRLAQELDDWEGMEEAVERAGERLLSRIGEDPSLQGVPFSQYGEQRTTDLSYGTGFLMFYLLYELVGEQTLDQVLGEHYAAHRQSGGSFEELIDRAGQATERDLEPFFRDWVSTTGWQRRLEEVGSVAALLEHYRRISRGRDPSSASARTTPEQLPFEAAGDRAVFGALSMTRGPSTGMARPDLPGDPWQYAT